MQTSLFEKLSFITVYSISSIATFDLNKYIMKKMDFNMEFLLVTLQCIIIVYIIMMQSLISKVHIRYSQHKKWYLLSILLTSMMLTGMKAIRYFPPTLFTIYKNTAIIITAFAELYFFGRQVTWIALISFLVMIFSSLFGNSIDKVELAGYLWMAANVISTTAYVLYLKKLMALDLSTRTESVLFTNLLSAPLTMLLSLLFDTYTFPPISLKLVILIVLSGVTAYLTSFSTAWAMKVLSSTSYSMIGALNKLALSATGFILFDEKYSNKKMMSLLIGIIASLIYSLDSAKTLSISQTQQAQETLESH